MPFGWLCAMTTPAALLKIAASSTFRMLILAALTLPSKIACALMTLFLLFKQTMKTTSLGMPTYLGSKNSPTIWVEVRTVPTEYLSFK